MDQITPLCPVSVCTIKNLYKCTWNPHEKKNEPTEFLHKNTDMHAHLKDRRLLYMFVTMFGVYVWPFRFKDASIARKVLAISEKVGLLVASAAQHFSINDLHAGSHDLGIVGRNVLFTMPPTQGNFLSNYIF